MAGMARARVWTARAGTGDSQHTVSACQAAVMAHGSESRILPLGSFRIGPAVSSAGVILAFAAATREFRLTDRMMGSLVQVFERRDTMPHHATSIRHLVALTTTLALLPTAPSAARGCVHRCLASGPRRARETPRRQQMRRRGLAKRPRSRNT